MSQEKFRVFVKDNVVLESKVYEHDIGIDVKARTMPTIVGKRLIGTTEEQNMWSRITYVEYDTEIFIDSLSKHKIEQVFPLAFPRSSVSKKNLILANGVGVIDPNYRDSIKVRFKYILQPEDLKFNAATEQFYCSVNYDEMYKMGDLIGQLIFAQSLNVEIVYVPALSETDRGTGKFGSTDKIRGL